MSPGGVWNCIRLSNIYKTVTQHSPLYYSDFTRLYHYSHQRHNLPRVILKQHCKSASDGNGQHHFRFLSTTNASDNTTANKAKPSKYIPPAPAEEDSKSSDIKDKTTVAARQPATFKEIYAEALRRTTGGLGVKGLIKEYGLPFTIWYSTLYFGGMATCYLVLESGLVGEEGVLEWVRMTPIADYVDLSKMNPKFGNAAGAVVINEILEVIRLPVAILTIPRIKAAWDKRRAVGQKKPNS